MATIDELLNNNPQNPGGSPSVSIPVPNHGTNIPANHPENSDEEQREEDEIMYDSDTEPEKEPADLTEEQQQRLQELNEAKDQQLQIDTGRAERKMARHFHDPNYKLGILIGGYVLFGPNSTKDVSSIVKAIKRAGVDTSAVRVKGTGGKTFDLYANENFNEENAEAFSLALGKATPTLCEDLQVGVRYRDATWMRWCVIRVTDFPPKWGADQYAKVLFYYWGFPLENLVSMRRVQHSDGYATSVLDLYYTVVPSHFTAWIFNNRPKKLPAAEGSGNAQPVWSYRSPARHFEPYSSDQCKWCRTAHTRRVPCENQTNLKAPIEERIRPTKQQCSEVVKRVLRTETQPDRSSEVKPSPDKPKQYRSYGWGDGASRSNGNWR